MGVAVGEGWGGGALSGPGRDDLKRGGMGWFWRGLGGGRYVLAGSQDEGSRKKEWDDRTKQSDIHPAMHGSSRSGIPERIIA
jgi:hypothetical protein